MDYSAPSEAQPPQYYSSQQQEPQQQQQDPNYHQQAAYAQSYAAYYAAYHHQSQQHDASQYNQQQYAAAAYPHNRYHQYYYSGQDSSSSYQAGPAQPETAGVGPSNPTQIHGYAASVNPADATAAVAALSRLSDTMDRATAAANMHWHGKGGPPHLGIRGRGRSSNRGGGRRGGFSFQDGGEPSALRGRGRGRGQMGWSHGRKSYHSGEQPLAPESAQQAPPASVLQRRPVLPLAWCDICRVDCNSLESLEQHKIGKRHKKTVQRVDEIQKQQRLFDEMQAKVTPEMALQSTEADPAVQAKEVYQSSSVVGTTPNDAGLSAQVGYATEVSIGQEITPSAVLPAVKVDDTNRAIGVYDRFDRHRGDLKRHMTRFGRGGKRVRIFESVHCRVPKRPRDQPRVCTLCDLMCDTLAVFECHLSGKKHMYNLSRFQGQGSVFGPITVYIPPNQPSTYPTNGQEPVFYGLKPYEVLQQEASGDLNGLQVGNYGHYLSERPMDAGIGGPNSQAMEILHYPEGEFVAAKEDSTVTHDTVALDSEKDPSLAPIALVSATNSEAVVPFNTREYLGAEVEELGPK